jgi:hypothetical protein
MFIVSLFTRVPDPKILLNVVLDVIAVVPSVVFALDAVCTSATELCCPSRTPNV